MSGGAAGPAATPVRYVVIGAGAVGITLAAGLHRTGADVLLVARGRRLAALRSGGCGWCGRTASTRSTCRTRRGRGRSR